jgi:hypothetical protein
MHLFHHVKQGLQPGIQKKLVTGKGGQDVTACFMLALVK